MMFAKWFRKSLLVSAICLLSTIAWAQPYSGPGGEDTILIEKEVSQKIPYHKLAKSLVNRFLKFDSDQVLSFGQNRSDSVVRHFSDLAERTKYRVNVHQDEVELKFSLNF